MYVCVRGRWVDGWLGLVLVVLVLLLVVKGGGLSLCQYDMVTLMSCSNKALWQSFNGRCSIQNFQLCLSFYPRPNISERFPNLASHFIYSLQLFDEFAQPSFF